MICVLVAAVGSCKNKQARTWSAYLRPIVAAGSAGQRWSLEATFSGRSQASLFVTWPAAVATNKWAVQRHSWALKEQFAHKLKLRLISGFQLRRSSLRLHVWERTVLARGSSSSLIAVISSEVIRSRCRLLHARSHVGLMVYCWCHITALTLEKKNRIPCENIKYMLGVYGAPKPSSRDTPPPPPLTFTLMNYY